MPEPAEETEETSVAAAEAATEEAPTGGLRNRRPTGKATHRLRRRTTRGTVALDE